MPSNHPLRMVIDWYRRKALILDIQGDHEEAKKYDEHARQASVLYNTESILDKQIKIADWFDPHEREHLEAWSHLQNTGLWPKGFVPDSVEIGPLWIIEIATKIADCWVSHALSAHI